MPNTRPEGSRIPAGSLIPPAPRLSRLLVRDVSRDHFVHGLARMANAFFADHDVDRGHALVGRDALDLLARHVAHEPGGHAVEPRGRLLGPDEEIGRAHV